MLTRRLDAKGLKQIIVGDSPFDDGRPHPAALAAAFLAKDCAGAVGLSDAVRARLQRLIPTKPPAP
jgi:hypothetical protein